MYIYSYRRGDWPRYCQTHTYTLHFVPSQLSLYTIQAVGDIDVSLQSNQSDSLHSPYRAVMRRAWAYRALHRPQTQDTTFTHSSLGGHVAILPALPPGGHFSEAPAGGKSNIPTEISPPASRPAIGQRISARGSSANGGGRNIWIFRG